MLHSKHIEVAANTTSADPDVTHFKVNKGVIYRVWVDFPFGCAHLVKMRLFLDEHPILPVDADKYITGNGHLFVYPLFVEITESPQYIKVYCWNDDDVYSHTVHLQILVIDPKWIVPVGNTKGLTTALGSLFKSRR